METCTIKAHETLDDDTQGDLQKWLYNCAHNAANCMPKNSLWVGKPVNDRFKTVEALNPNNGFLDHNVEGGKPWNVGDKLDNADDDINRDHNEESFGTRYVGRIVVGVTRVGGVVIG